MKVALVTRGRAQPNPGSRVRFDGLVYLVVTVEPFDEIDDETVVTVCDVQPDVAPRGAPVVEATLVRKEIS